MEEIKKFINEQEKILYNELNELSLDVSNFFKLINKNKSIYIQCF